MGSGRGTARAEDAQGTPTQSHISPSILAYEEIKLGFPPGRYTGIHNLISQTRAVHNLITQARHLGPTTCGRYKGIGVCLAALALALTGEYVDLGAFTLYVLPAPLL